MGIKWGGDPPELALDEPCQLREFLFLILFPKM